VPKTTLAELTTLRLGGPAAELVEAHDEAALVEAVSSADERGTPVLVVGGGSNLVVADEGYDGRVVLIRNVGLRVEADQCGGAYVEVGAGEDWDDVVATSVANGWVGVEALSGIPGTTGATPIQNVGAYGQEVAETVVCVRAYDRSRDEVVDLAAPECGFAYRSSRFKREPGRWVVLAVGFELERSDRSPPIRYAELARALRVGVGETAPIADVREAVLRLRRGKGMVIDPDDPDSVSAGSFFTNPILTREDFIALEDRTEEHPPAWPEPDKRHVKTSAAWLIERAGFTKGYGDPATVAISSKHTLALTNRGGGTAKQLVALASEIAAGVRERFGVTLVPEPVLVGLALDEGAPEAVDVAGPEDEDDVAATQARR